MSRAGELKQALPPGFAPLQTVQVDSGCRLPLEYEISNVFYRAPMQSDQEITRILRCTDTNVKQTDTFSEQGHKDGSNVNVDPNFLVDNLDPIDHFYTQDRLNDYAPQRNIYTNGYGAASTLTTTTTTAVHDANSRHIFERKLNSDYGIGIMMQNNCDSESSQPNVVEQQQQPSSGNVFNNFNDFIGNPRGPSLVNFAMPSEPNATQESRQNAGLIDVCDPFMNNYSDGNVDAAKTCSIDDLLTVKAEDLLQDRKENNCASPRYQNILLPIKVDPSGAEKCREPQQSAGNLLEQDLRFPDLLTDGNLQQPMSSCENPDRVAKSILDEPEHVYENVYIGTDIPKAQELYCAFEEPTAVRTDSGLKHTYENVNFQNPGVQQQQNFVNKDEAYQHLYSCVDSEQQVSRAISSEWEVPKTNKLSSQTNSKVLEIQNTLQNTSLSANPKVLAFPGVQPNNAKPPPPNEVAKPVVGFTTIDDMSEEELNKYLADLEAEERANEQAAALYENVQADSGSSSSGSGCKQPVEIGNSLSSAKARSFQRQDDEDANEAPIFESVTIGKLPQVAQEHFQEKVKQFPIIDYSKETYEDFACAKNLLDSTTHVGDNDDGGGECKKSNSNDSSNNKNCESTIDHRGVDSKNSSSKDFKSLESDNKLGSYSTVTPVRSTETISRFSVTRNVDVNDKIGGCSSSSNNKISKPGPQQQQQHSKTLDSKCLDDADGGGGGGGDDDEDNNTDECVESSDNDSYKPSRPQTLNVISTANALDNSLAGTVPHNQEASDTDGDKDSGRAPSPDVSESSSMESGTLLGKQPPFWVPDSDAPNCMLCDTKFTVVKRRHHCRACGKVLCNKCCNMRYRLEYQNNVDSRVCIPCHQLLTKAESDNGSGDYAAGCANANNSSINSPQVRPNPNNPMEYCSTIPPLQQLAGGQPPPPPTVMVPVGVLKREGVTKQRSEGPKSVMFSDGIRPGCDLTELDTTWDWKPTSARKTGPRRAMQGYGSSTSGKKQNRPPLDPHTNSYIPQDPASLPPTVTIHKGQVTYHEINDPATLYDSLKNECEPPVMFAINRNLYAYVKIINLNCCVNRVCWNVTSKGLACNAQDEVVFLVETTPDEKQVPRDLLLHINQMYHEAIKGNTISEYGMSIHQSGNLLGSREHAGFLFIRQTLQCLQKVIVPPAPFLVGLLVHRWETPWAKVFPLRLVLRLGAEYRYYPCPLVSVRFRDAVYFEIGHTIMKVLADFRNYAYTLPKVQGLTIHMQGRTTQVRFPKNRFNQVIKGLNNSNDHVLAFASNFSIEADSHLVCMQTNSEDESTYQTQAINIQNKPRKVTGASFIVINGALKSSMGLSANSSILEDGLMVQIMPEKMEALKAALKNMQDFTIGCGRQGAPEPDEIVNIKWVENDAQFNLGVKSPIDSKPMDGIPSIRVHNGINFAGNSRYIRWTEVFIIKSDDDQPFGIHYPVDINKLSESIARATCAALVKLLDLLAAAGLEKIAVRTTIHPDNVGYEAGSEGTRLPPIYMKSLDNELIQVLQKAVQGCEDTQTILELVFYVLDTDV